MDLSEVNLFIPGMPKCGSSFLYDALKQHPEICMHEKKEPNYFYEDLSEKQFLSGFKEDSATYFGEASVSYLVNRESLKRIRERSQNPKLLVLLRDPVKRAVSHYYHRYFGGVDSRRIEKILEDPSSKDAYPIFYSNYRLHLSNLDDLFGKNEYKVIISENLFSEKDKSLKSIFEFLELEPFEIDFSGVSKNTGRVPKNSSLEVLIRKLRNARGMKSRLTRALPFLGKLSLQVQKLNSSSRSSMEELGENTIEVLENHLNPQREFVRDFLSNSKIWLDK